MLFYLLVGPSAILLIIMYINLRRITKHDKVLFRFCQLRRDIMRLIDSEALQMSKADYRSLRTMLDATNVTIHEFNNFKITMFNFRWFISWLKKHKREASNMDKLATKNAQINKLFDEYRIALVKAVLSYTPFIKSQITIMVCLAVLQFLFRLGLRSLSLKNLVNYLSWLKDEMDTHSNHRPQHA